VARQSEECGKGIAARIIVIIAKSKLSSSQMEDKQCPNHIENARIARGRAYAVPAMEPADWLYKRARCVLPATLMAAGNAKIAGAWAVLIPPGIRPPTTMPNSPTTNSL
jgi:hypothetical protein